MSGYYRFAINYKGSNGSRLRPGKPPNINVCRNFKDDLAALGVGLPKVENIHIHSPGSISLVFYRDENDKDSNVRAFRLCDPSRLISS